MLLTNEKLVPDNHVKFLLDRNKSIFGKGQKNKRVQKNKENEVIYYNEDDYYREIDTRVDKKNRNEEEDIPEWQDQDINTIY